MGEVVLHPIGKRYKFISLLAMVVAIIATFYLFQDIYDDLKPPPSSPTSIAETTSPVTEVNPSSPVVVSEKTLEKVEILSQPGVEASSSVVAPPKIENPPKPDVVTTPEVVSSSPIEVPEVENPPINFTAYLLQPKQDIFETTADFQASVGCVPRT